MFHVIDIYSKYQWWILKIELIFQIATSVDKQTSKDFGKRWDTKAEGHGQSGVHVSLSLYLWLMKIQRVKPQGYYRINLKQNVL